MSARECVSCTALRAELRRIAQMLGQRPGETRLDTVRRAAEAIATVQAIGGGGLPS